MAARWAAAVSSCACPERGIHDDREPRHRRRSGQHRLGRQALSAGRRFHRHPHPAARIPAQPGRAPYRPGRQRRRSHEAAGQDALRRGAVRLQPGRRQEWPASAGRDARAQPDGAIERVADGVGREKRGIGDGRGRAPARRLPDQTHHGRRAADAAEPRVAQEAGVSRNRPGLHGKGLFARGQIVRRADRAQQAARAGIAAHEGIVAAEKRRAGKGPRRVRKSAGRARLQLGQGGPGQDPHE